MALIDGVKGNMNCETKFVQYNQSEKCQSQDDCSVSYASSYTVIDN